MENEQVKLNFVTSNNLCPFQQPFSRWTSAAGFSHAN